MRSPHPRALALLLALVAAPSPALADPVHWGYRWDPDPRVLRADPVFVPLHVPAGTAAIPPWVGQGKVTFDGGHREHVAGSSDIVAARLSGESRTPAWFPATFTNDKYTLKLFLRDTDNHLSGTLTFRGALTGTLSRASAMLRNHFVGATTQSLTLGQDVFTVTVGPYSPPGPPGGGSDGMIGASVQVHRLKPTAHPSAAGIASIGPASGISLASAPEPSALALAGLGSVAAGALAWRRRRRLA
jgi:hypothetical protein